MDERPGAWLPRLTEVGERLAEEWQAARRAREGASAPAERSRDATGPHAMRASDADRERIAEVLREAVSDGRLGMAEFEERLERVFKARTLGDLAGITEDLLPPEQQPLRLDGGQVSAIFKKEHREGRWVVPAELPVTAMFGTTKLDLRDAIMQSRRVVINATLVFGGLEIHVPEGVEVIRVSKDKTVKLTRQPVEPDSPVIEVRTSNFLGEVKVKEPPKRRRGRR
ncbi:DUF1707 domain-containing protein [Spongiactinospora sp. TRM90649]|uniref:DUF1707 SHOCT-like domain-containing protein n=1 Tax=Spongiactinospora sp. TRM90649 TaxID=3031114 RepID=UPI0023F99C72|nr:DUF1707 domain-containing protein [Spongiactinospora sp. TRM90649]MDF5754718.1 DUF1707 domain-containing protein [Spongiactinospora sp. TRM90649]